MSDQRAEFGRIFDQYIGKIYRFIYLKVSSKEAAEDLASETFTRAWEVFSQQDPSPIKNPGAFLYKVAKNLVVDFYREKGKARIVAAEETTIADPRPDLETKAILASDINQMKVVLASINEDYQELIIWRYLDELSIGEIAEIMNKSEEAVRVQLHRALASLRQAMERK